MQVSKPLRVLIAPDKFKGTLTALEAARAIATGWRKIRPNDRLELVPISDGGDGFGEVVSRFQAARPRSVATVDAAHRPCRSVWWHAKSARTAIIESANIIGLAMVPRGQYRPFELDTFGLGKALRNVAEAGPSKCLIGIGGSATNDGGFGLARALGWRFVAGNGEQIQQWTALDRLARICPPERHRCFRTLLVAVDVKNPLLGKNGATRVYGPQKGIQPGDMKKAEACLRRLSQVWAGQYGGDHASEPGAGAAGGLGFGLKAFAGGQLRPGFELVAKWARLRTRVRQADLVITGEGAIDPSTLMGKGVGQLAELSRQADVPVLALGGRMDLPACPKALFASMHGLTELATPEQAMAHPAFYLQRLASRAAHAALPPSPHRAHARMTWGGPG